MSPVPAWFFGEQRSKSQECMTCHRFTLEHKLMEVQTRRQTYWEPAEYDYQCDQCAEQGEIDA